MSIAVHVAALPDGRPCWTFVTTGMTAKRHPELILSVVMREDEVAARYPADAIELLGTLADAIPDQLRMDPWMSVTFQGALFGSQWTGIAAVPAAGPVGLELPDDAVALQLLTAGETVEAREHGAVRVTAMLGRHERFYPTAWWFDRDRPDLLTRAQAASSKLAGMRGVRVDGLTTVFELPSTPVRTTGNDGVGALTGGRLRVRVTAEAAPDLARALRGLSPDDGLLAIVVPDEQAGGQFVWTPGAQDAQVISGPGFTGRISGSFLGILVSDRRTGSTLLEDGAMLGITPAVRDAVATALEAGRDYQAVPMPDALPWSVEITRAPRAGTRSLVELRLVTPEDQLAQRVSEPDLLVFLDAIEREVIDAARAARPSASTVYVHVELRPGDRTIRLEPVSDDRGPWLADLEKRIARLPPVVVTGEVKVRATYSLAIASDATP